jgi:RNA polymerase sigma-70 factor (ECF subfamily)
MDARAGAARFTEGAGPEAGSANAARSVIRAVPDVGDAVDVGEDESVSQPGRSPITADFDDLFRSTYPKLVRALSVASDGGAAADAVQEAFVQADVHWRLVSRLDNPGAWVRRAAINRLANHRRGLRRRDAAVARLDAREATVTLDPADLDLAAAVRALPEKQRLVICLHHLADLSIAEVADTLGVAPGTVKSNLHDARLALRAQLEDRSDG